MKANRVKEIKEILRNEFKEVNASNISLVSLFTCGGTVTEEEAQKIFRNEAIEKLISNFGMSQISASAIFECAKALDKYESLPVDIKDSIQIICDIYNVCITWNKSKKRNGGLILEGVWNPAKSMSLSCYFEKEYNKVVRKAKNKQKYGYPFATLFPYNENKLTEWTILNTGTGEYEKWNGKQ